MKRRKRGRPKKRRKTYVGPLKLLLEFLNYKPGQSVSTELRNCIHYIRPNKLASVQQELIGDLSVFTNPPRKGAYDLRSLLRDKINDFRFPLILTSNTPVQVTKNEIKEVGGWTFDFELGVGTPYDARREMYAAVAEGMVRRDLTMLRRCPYCEQFFIADENRQMFCRRKHARAYWDDKSRAKMRVDKSRGKI